MRSQAAAIKRITWRAEGGPGPLLGPPDPRGRLLAEARRGRETALPLFTRGHPTPWSASARGASKSEG
eukprot:3244840-Pyramimonas_sp.AAC.1